MANSVYDRDGEYKKPNTDDPDAIDEENRNEVGDAENEAAEGEDESIDKAETKKTASPEDIKRAEARAAKNSTDPSLALVGGTEQFFNPDKDKPKRRFRLRTPVGQFTRSGRLAIGGGGALIGVGILGFSLFSFLNVFKLDTMLKNIDAKTFSRYNAQFARRSNAYLKAYIRVRMLEYRDATGHYGDKDGNIFFRAGHTDDKFKDWYTKLRGSNFESELAREDGIVFTSSIDKNGKIHPARITFKGDDIYPSQLSPSVAAAYSDVASSLADGNNNKFVENLNRFGEQMDNFVETQIFESDKAARKEIKNVVNDRTKFFQVVKRRRVRKNIQNMIGVRDWTFFEKTAAKYEEKKTNIQQKIISKILPDNNALANLLECIFTGSKCNTNNDIAHTEATNETIPNQDKATDEKKDSKGKTIKNEVPLDGKDVANAADNAIKDTAGADLSKEQSKNYTQRIVKIILEKTVGPEIASTASSTVNPAAIWKRFKQVANIVHVVKNKTFSKLVKAARSKQSAAVYTMLGTAGSQMHTGENTAKEVNELMGAVSGFENSEGWVEVIGKGDTLKAAAATTKPQPAKDKKEYCNGSHVKQRDEFAWACDDIKPNGGSTAGDLEAAFNGTVGYILNPIADAVDAVQSIPIITPILDTFNSFTDAIISKVTDATIMPILESTGLTKNIGSILMVAMQKVLAFGGVIPAWTGVEPGVANLATIGGAGVAEGSTRAAGGVVSTKTTLDYSNKTAINYEKDQLGNESAFERYASINNPDSLAAKSLFSVSTMSLSSMANSLANIFGNLGSLFSNLFTGRMFAASTPDTPSSIATWAGVDTYDIPPKCETLNPLDPNYVQAAVGVQDDSPYASTAKRVVKNIRGDITADNERDDTAFWKMVYDEIGSRADAEDIAGAIYNCALLDRQVEGGLAYKYGYTDDGGLEPGQSSGNSNVNTGTAATGSIYWVGDSLSVGMNSSGQLPQKLSADGLTLTRPVEATVGINVGGSIPKVQADSASVKSAANIVVELGTNNCSLGGSPSCMGTDAFQGQITSMVNAIRAINPTAKIYWVNVYTTKGAVYQSINTALNNLSGSLNYKVVDWAGEVTSHPGKYHFDSQLGVHLTGSGYSDMAQFIVGSLKQ